MLISEEDKSCTESLDNLGHLIDVVRANKTILGHEFCAEVAKASTKFMKELSKSVGKNILHKIHEKKPSEESLRAIITAIPSALSVKDDDGLFPIQSIIWNSWDATRYIALLAKEGKKYGVGGKGKRGGLLNKCPFSSQNILQSLSTEYEHDFPLESDGICLRVLNDLREAELLTVQDIRNHNLLFWACGEGSRQRFQYLSAWDPEALKMSLHNGGPLFHQMIHIDELGGIEMFLRVTLQHFPKELGLLFQRNNKGATTLEALISSRGKENTLEFIRKCLPPDTPLPILHHVAKHTPQYINNFACYYPHAVHLKDGQEDKRTLCQTRLASGHLTFQKEAMFFIGMSPEQIETIDPVTDLYPFMVAASDNICDLDSVFYLLRRKPNLVYETSDYFFRKRFKRQSSAQNSSKEENWGKRKRVKIKNEAQI